MSQQAVKFAYWVPNVSGGLVVSKIEQRTDWGIDYNRKLAQIAELKNAGVYRQFCPMAFNDQGAYWLSPETEIRNPYFGKKMLACGEVRDSL